MTFLDWSFPTPEANLACDEALLDACDHGHGPEVLRFWEPPRTFVVLGYANRVTTEVHREACRADGVPILRRITGGGTVLQTPGCLNYALVLCPEGRGEHQTISATNASVLERMRRALLPLVGDALGRQGDTDLALGLLKWAGNAQRRKRRALLFHGAFLLRADLALMERYLPLPARQPAYREGRSHRRFLTRIDLPAPILKQAIQAEWDAHEPLADVPHAAIAALVHDKYASPDWTLRA